MFQKLYFLVFSAIFAACAASTSAAESFDYRFNVKLGPVKIGEMQVASSNDGRSYSAGALLYTTGLAGAVYDVRYDFSAKGMIGVGGALVPTKYESVSEEKDSTSRVNIAFSGDRVAKVTFNPDSSVPANVLSYRRALDPMSLIYFLLRPTSNQKACSGTVDLFDGRYLSSVAFNNIKRYNDGRVTCDITYSSDSGGGGLALSSLVFTPDNNGLLQIQSFAAKTKIGTLVLQIK